MREVGLDFRCAERGGVPAVMKQDEPADPVDILLLRPVAVMERAQLLPDLVEQARAGFHARAWDVLTAWV